MNKNLIKGTIVGGVFLFVWYGGASMIPGRQSPIKTFNNEQEVIKVIQRNSTALPGMYFLNRADEYTVGEGVWGWISIHASEDYDLTNALLGSLILQIIVGFCLTWILLQLSHFSFGKRLRTIMILAVLATVVSAISFWNWSLLPASFAIMQSAELLVGWFLTGLILAKLLPSDKSLRSD